MEGGDRGEGCEGGTGSSTVGGEGVARWAGRHGGRRGSGKSDHVGWREGRDEAREVRFGVESSGGGCEVGQRGKFGFTHGGDC